LLLLFADTGVRMIWFTRQASLTAGRRRPILHSSTVPDIRPEPCRWGTSD